MEKRKGGPLKGWQLVAGAAIGLLAVLIPSPAMQLRSGWGLTGYGVFVALGALLAVLLYRAEWKENLPDPLQMAVCLIPAGVIGARALYCVIRFPFFMEFGLQHIFFLWEGGFFLYGAVLCVVPAACRIADRSGRARGDVLDALACPGLLCIMVCRFGEGLAGEGLGNWVENESLWFFPLSMPNVYGEYQWAVFVLEAAVAGGILLFVRHRNGAPGEKFADALLLYAACQIFLESLRMDSVLKIGFVRMAQVLSAITVLGVSMIRWHEKKGKRGAVSAAGIICACAGGIGGLEWALEKTPFNNILLYSLMILFCGIMAWCGMRYRRKSKT